MDRPSTHTPPSPWVRTAEDVRADRRRLVVVYTVLIAFQYGLLMLPGQPGWRGGRPGVGELLWMLLAFGIAAGLWFGRRGFWIAGLVVEVLTLLMLVLGTVVPWQAKMWVLGASQAATIVILVLLGRRRYWTSPAQPEPEL